MKQECVFSHDGDMTEADVYVRPQDGMTSGSLCEDLWVFSCLIEYRNVVSDRNSCFIYFCVYFLESYTTAKIRRV